MTKNLREVSSASIITIRPECNHLVILNQAMLDSGNGNIASAFEARWREVFGSEVMVVVSDKPEDVMKVYEVENG